MMKKDDQKKITVVSLIEEHPRHCASGIIAHTAIELDVFFKLVPQGNIVAFEVPIPGVGRVDLIVNFGVYEIKPLGGTVNPNPQLSRYLAALTRFAAGTYPFDDYVSSNLLPLPAWVQLWNPRCR